jgi:hypothetical protein
MKNPTLTWVPVAVIGALLGAIAYAQGPSATQTGPIDTVAVEMTPYGFFPQQLSHTAGTFFLFVHNVSGPAPRSLAFSAVTNAASTILHQPSLSQARPHWVKLVSLTSGTYTVSEANHPSWTCTITVK